MLYDDDLSSPASIGPSREKLVDRLASSLNVLRTRTPSAVMALVGPWGSGKSTLLAHLEDKLIRDGEWQIATFNPWSYSSLEAAVPGFFSEITSALPPESNGKDHRKAIGDWIERFAPVGAAAGIFGIDGTGAIQTVGKMISGDQSPERLKTNAEELLAELKQPILMMVDDLDRLGPDELLLTFKLVRLLGRLPNVYYVLSYDEATLQDILMKTGLVAENPSRAREYMEKMVQLRLDIPTMLPQERSQLVNAALEEVLSNHSIEFTDTDSNRLSQAWSACLVQYISQPRAAKRLFTQVDATWPDVAGEVDFVDYVLATFLRTFESTTFGLLENRSEELIGGFDDRWMLRQKESHTERWERWKGYIESAGAKHPKAVADLLAELFIPLKSAKDNMSYGNSHTLDMAKRKGIGHPHYFHRYTQTGVPTGDIADNVILNFVSELGSQKSGQFTDEVGSMLRENAELVISKLLRMPDLPARPLLAFVLEHYEAISELKIGFFAPPASRAFAQLIKHLLLSVPADEALELIRSGCTSQGGLSLICDSLRSIQHEGERPENEAEEWLEEGLSIASAKIQSDLLQIPLDASDSQKELSLRNLWALRDFWPTDNLNGLQDFVWELTNSDAHWNLHELLAFLLQEAALDNRHGQWTELIGFDPSDVDVFLGTEKVATVLNLSNVPFTDEPRNEQRFENSASFSEKKSFMRERFPMRLK